MTADEKADFIARIRRIQVQLAERGLKLVGYEVAGDRILPRTEPLERRRKGKAAPASDPAPAPPPPAKRVIRRGAVQDELPL